MAGLRHIGGPTIQRLQDITRGLPVMVATTVARRGAPVITALAKQSFAAGRTAYGDVRRLGLYGPLSLVQSGAVRDGLLFEALGTMIRCKFPTAYTKYLVGKYWILPSVHSLPAPWLRALHDIVRQERARAARAEVAALPAVRRAA